METNLVHLIEEFGSDDRCRAYMEELRWPDGLECPRCHGTTISRIYGRGQFDCDSCRYQFSVTAGTTFHDSHLSLWKWFLAIYLMVESKKGISAKQLQRTLDVSYKTAWYLSHRIRDAMGSIEESPLVGVVEVDETLIGGKRPGAGRGFRENKTVVIGAIQRGGNVRLRVIPNTRRHHVEEFIEGVIDHPNAIYTDELKSYDDVAITMETRHETVTHKAEEYVRGDVHTNTVESAWSLFKRAVIGSYHQISVKHLPAYLDEFEWRYNGRNNPYLFRDTLLVLLHSDPLPMKELVGKRGSSYGVNTQPSIVPLDPEGHQSSSGTP
jgi:transposase-like protein